MHDSFLLNSSVETQKMRFRRIEHDFSFLNDLLNSLNFGTSSVFSSVFWK